MQSSPPAAPPTLLLMKGHPATGKSTLAHALARRLAWPLVDKDDVKDFTVDLPDGNALAYRIMWQVTARQLRLGLSVIVDSPLSYPMAYATGCELASTHRARLLVVETTLPPAEWRRRLETPDREGSSHKIRSWARMEAQLATYDGCWQYPIAPDHHVLVETTGSPAQSVAQVIARL